MRTVAIGVALVLGAAPASAQTLWGKIEVGMSAEQVRALYPGERVQQRGERTIVKGHKLIEQCRADIRIHHPGGRVREVELKGEPAVAGQCASAIFAVMRRDLGQPLSAVSGRPSMLKRERTTYQWDKGGVRLRFVRYSTEGWGGAGLGNADRLAEPDRAERLSFGPAARPLLRLGAQSAKLAGDGVALEVGLHRLEPLPLQVQTDVGGGGALARTGKLERPFERAEGKCHETHMGAPAGNT